MIKFLPLSGSPRQAVDFCMGPISSDGSEREVVRLRGNEEIFVSVSSALSFREQYKSCVIAWSPGDVPSSEVLDCLLDDFSILCFSGLHPTRFAWVAFEHRNRDKVDVHVLVANVDLASGRHFNPSPPGARPAFDALRDFYNFTYGWARPDDVKNSSLVWAGRRPSFVAARRRRGLPVEASARMLVHSHVLRALVRGRLGDRTDLINRLAQRYTVLDVQPERIVVEPVGGGRNIALRGALFSEDFEFKKWEVFRRRRRTQANQEADRDAEEAKLARKRLVEAVRRRAESNLRRYGGRGREMNADDPFEESVAPGSIGLAQALVADAKTSLSLSSIRHHELNANAHGSTFAGFAGAVAEGIRQGFRRLGEAVARFAERMGERRQNAGHANQVIAGPRRSTRTRSIRGLGRLGRP